MTAAVYAARKRIDTLLLSNELGGQPLTTVGIENYMGYQYILVSLTPLTGDQILIDKVKDAPNLSIFLEHEVVEIKGSSRVEGIAIRDLKTGKQKKLKVGGVFIEIGLIPNSELARDITKLNKFGEIEVNCACQTGIPGLFAAGDVTDVPEKQIVVAAGEGAKAALQAHRYLQRL